MKTKKQTIVQILASLCYLGHFPWYSGTFATVVAGVPIYLCLCRLESLHFAVVFTLFFFFSVYISHEGERIYGRKDPKEIVIDEAVGLLATFLFIEYSHGDLLLGLVLFRIFDGVKVFPANLAEKKLPGGWAVVVDDVFSGFYANIGIRLVHLVSDRLF